MTVRAPRRSGMLLFSGGNAIAQIAALARYVLLARLLGPEQLGLAATLILTSQFFEAVTDGGLDRFLVQARAGNLGSVNRMVHTMLAMRGLAIALSIAVTSAFFARHYHNESLRGALLLLALSPAIAGFVNFDFRRVQRRLRFGPEGLVTSLSESAALVTTVVVAVVTRSFIAVSAGLVVRSAVIVTVSHLLARRRYRLGVSRLHAPDIFKFGFPLMINGLLLFLGGQGDRLFIGNMIGLSDLGRYSAIILLIYYPATLVGRFLQSVSVPAIAAARDNPTARKKIYEGVAGTFTLTSIFMMCGFALIAPLLVPHLYGSRFVQPALLVALIGTLQACRFTRLWPATVAVAAGRSKFVMWSSVTRLIAFPAAFLIVRYQSGLVAIVVVFAAAELLAVLVSLVQLNRIGLGGGRRDWFRLTLLTIAMVSIAMVASDLSATAMIVGTIVTISCMVALAWLERLILSKAIDFARYRFGPRYAPVNL